MNLRDIPVEAQALTFLPTRYFGSKRKQIVWLANELKLVKGTTAIDPFGGTGTVSAALGAMGFTVTFCDVFRFNEISARAIFRKSSLSLIKHIEFLHSVKPHNGFISKTFSGKYFTDTENEWLDGFANAVNQLGGQVLDKNALFYAVFQACLKKRPYNLFHRTNLNLRSAEGSKSFGNWYTWRKSFVEHASQALTELATFRKSNSSKVRILNSRCATKHTGYYDLIYIDPPYFKKAKAVESYLQRYHFLEGLSNYEEWPSLVDGDSPLKSFHRKNAPAEWKTIDDLTDGFEKLISRIDSRAVALSYIDGQTPSSSTLAELVSRSFKNVRIAYHRTPTVLSKQWRDEILIIGEGRR